MDKRLPPFRIVISKPETVKRVIEVQTVALIINAVEFDGEPWALVEFFERLLEENPIFTDGLELTANKEFKRILLSSRVAFEVDRNGPIFPTDEFRMIARDLLGNLRMMIPPEEDDLLQYLAD